jgi:hypothetical protein
VLGQDDKRDYSQPYQRSNHQRQGKKYLVFPLGRKRKPALAKPVCLRFGSYFGGRNTHSSSLLEMSRNDELPMLWN